MKPIVIVPCGARKQQQACPAQEMYTGPYHRACMAYARSIAPDSSIYILSAFYGLLSLDERINPYDLKMGDPGCVGSALVHSQARDLGLLKLRVVALGGQLYTDLCHEVWPHCEMPLAGVGGMGKHMRWLKQQTQQTTLNL